MTLIIRIVRSILVLLLTLGLLWLIFSGYTLFLNIPLPFHQIETRISDLIHLSKESIAFAYPNFHVLIYALSRILPYLYFIGMWVIITGIFMIIYKHQSKGKKRLLIKGYLLFLFLFAIEIVLRSFGFRPENSSDGRFDFTTSMDERQYTFSDSVGINRLISNEFAPSSYAINDQGFNSPYQFTRLEINRLKQSRPVVMLIGDSFVEGCCPEDGKKTFAQHLNRGNGIFALNFGVGGTDPLQYELITSRYVPILKPNLVVVCLTFSNDFIPYERIPSPGLPIHFQTNKGFISSQFPVDYGGVPNQNYTTATEAWEAYQNRFSIFGKEAKWYEVISRSLSIFSIVLSNEKKYAKEVRVLRERNPKYIAKNLLKMEEICHESGIPVLFTAIPAKFDIAQDRDIRKAFQPLIPVDVQFPEDLIISDYESEYGGHFNASGHAKYAVFLENLIHQKLNKNHQGFSKNDLSNP